MSQRKSSRRGVVREWLRNWLGIQDPVTPRDWSDEMAELRMLIERHGEIECSYCKKLVKTYPYGGGYYRNSDGSVLCSNDCLAKCRSEETRR